MKNINTKLSHLWFVVGNDVLMTIEFIPWINVHFMYAGAFGGQEIIALNRGFKWQIAFLMAAKMTVTAI